MDSEHGRSKERIDDTRMNPSKISQGRVEENNGRRVREEPGKKDSEIGKKDSEIEELSNIPPPKRLSDVKQELKQLNQNTNSMNSKDSSLNIQKEAPLNSQKDAALSNKQSYARTSVIGVEKADTR